VYWDKAWQFLGVIFWSFSSPTPCYCCCCCCWGSKANAVSLSYTISPLRVGLKGASVYCWGVTVLCPPRPLAEIGGLYCEKWLSPWAWWWTSITPAKEGGRDRRIIVHGQLRQKKLAWPYLIKTNWAWWYISVIPAAWEVEDPVHGGPRQKQETLSKK
jgi:hypothetical protein